MSSVIEQDFSLLRTSKVMLHRDLLELTTFGAEKQISDKDVLSLQHDKAIALVRIDLRI